MWRLARADVIATRLNRRSVAPRAGRFAHNARHVAQNLAPVRCRRAIGVALIAGYSAPLAPDSVGIMSGLELRSVWTFVVDERTCSRAQPSRRRGYV